MSSGNAVLKRRNAYRRIFLNGEGGLSQDAELVLRDLAKFCRWGQSTTVVSPNTQQTDVPASFQAEGRREVYLRILSNLHVSDADLIRMLTARMNDD